MAHVASIKPWVTYPVLQKKKKKKNQPVFLLSVFLLTILAEKYSSEVQL
jgi:hypothetical protein